MFLITAIAINFDPFNNEKEPETELPSAENPIIKDFFNDIKGNDLAKNIRNLLITTIGLTVAAMLTMIGKRQTEKNQVSAQDDIDNFLNLSKHPKKNKKQSNKIIESINNSTFIVNFNTGEEKLAIPFRIYDIKRISNRPVISIDQIKAGGDPTGITLKDIPLKDLKTRAARLINSERIKYSMMVKEEKAIDKLEVLTNEFMIFSRKEFSEIKEEVLAG